MRKLPLLRSCVCIASFLSSIAAFSVTLGTPTQCDPYTVSWTGGQAPFEILFTPKSSPLCNVPVPPSAFINGKGSYTIPELPFTSTTEFVLTMSDGTGFASGGTSTLQTVGNPIESNNCNTKLTQDFTFELSMELKQCAWFNVTNYTGAILPVNIGILIPGGATTLFQNENTTDFGWIADVVEGTSLLFFMTDSQGRQGGVSDLEQVANSTDASCLVTSPLPSTASVAPPTSSQSTSSSSSGTLNAGVIAGAVVGSVAFVALVTILGIYYRRKCHPVDDDNHTVFTPIPPSSGVPNLATITRCVNIAGIPNTSNHTLPHQAPCPIHPPPRRTSPDDFTWSYAYVSWQPGR